MVHGAVYDAVNSIDERYEPYLVEVRARDWYSKDAAAAAAAYRVLLGIVSNQEPTLTPLYNASLASIPPGAAKDGGIRVGEVAAAAMLADRKNDGRGGAYRFPAPTMPSVGEWRPVLPAFGNDPAAWIKDVRPFLIREPVLGPAPYPLTSKKYAREFDEVKAVGSLNSATRTADQTDQARFWIEGPQPWTRAARQLAIDRRLRSIETARMFAMQYMAGADALISVWNGKAHYLFWRPITAIREADRDENPATQPDTGWLPLINTPAVSRPTLRPLGRQRRDVRGARGGLRQSRQVQRQQHQLEHDAELPQLRRGGRRGRRRPRLLRHPLPEVRRGRRGGRARRRPDGVERYFERD